MLRPLRGTFLFSSSLSLSALVLPLLVGCGGGGTSNESVGSQSDQLPAAVAYGVDYSWARPSPSSLRADGFTFAARYLSYNTSGKNISAGEANGLRAAGVDVVVVWEQNAQDALSGYNLGRQDATDAESQAAAAGMPSGRPIYFAVDFDAPPGDQPAIDSYFDGVASVLGVGRTGVYGGYWVVKRLFDAGKVTWGWQTYAWSGGNWDSRAQLLQIQNGILGGQADKDQAVAGDFGQWGAAGPPPPPPPAASRGSLDAANCTQIAGWAQDPNVATQAINADVYFNGPAGHAGALGFRLDANEARSDLCAALGSCNHAFTMATPRGLMDGKAHEVYAYAIATQNVGNPLLGSAPKTFTCAPPAFLPGTIKRHVANPAIFTAWGFDGIRDVAPYGTIGLVEGAEIATAPELVAGDGDPAVYLVDQGTRRHVINPASFAAWRFSWSAIKKLDAATASAMPVGPDWPTTPALASAADGTGIFLLDVAPNVAPSGAAEGFGPGDAHGGVVTPIGQGTPEGAAPVPSGAADMSGDTSSSSSGCAVGGAGTSTGSASSGLFGLLAFAFLFRRRS